MEIADFYQMCQDNIRHLEELERRCREKSSNPQRHERLFAKVRDEGKISMNRSESSLRRFMDNGSMTNVHRSGKPVDPKRLAWDCSFQQGDLVSYGALNIGGSGVLKYGEYCVAINQDELEKWGYLRYDSLYEQEDKCIYLLNDRSAADLERVKTDLAPESHKAHLAVLKHCKDVTGMSLEKMLCRSDCYIEAQMLGPVPLNVVLEVRVPKLSSLKENAYRLRRKQTPEAKKKALDLLELGRKVGKLMREYRGRVKYNQINWKEFDCEEYAEQPAKSKSTSACGDI